MSPCLAWLAAWKAVCELIGPLGLGWGHLSEEHTHIFIGVTVWVYYRRSRSVNTSRSVILKNQTYATHSKPFVWLKHTLCVCSCQDNLTCTQFLFLWSSVPGTYTQSCPYPPPETKHTFHLLYHAQVAHFQAMMSWSMCQAFRWLSKPSITTATKTQHIHVHPYMSV